MGDTAEIGGSLAWRLLATLKGGSLVLAASALLAYTARRRLRGRRRARTVHTVLITNATNTLGKELKSQLESRGVVVSTVASGATGGAGSEQVDALVVVGAKPRPAGLDGLADLVSEDVYVNLKFLDTLSPLVRCGGYMAWACAGAGAEAGAYRGAADAFDATLHASLQHTATAWHCQPVWVGRCETEAQAAQRVVAALLPYTTHVYRFSFRNAAFTVTHYVGRWFKIVTLK